MPMNTGTPGLRDNRLQATGVPQSVYLTPSLALRLPLYLSLSVSFYCVSLCVFHLKCVVEYFLPVMINLFVCWS